MALIDWIADGLADQMAGDGEALEAVVEEQLPLGLEIGRGGDGPVHVEVVAPAGELDSVVPHLLDQGGELRERQVGPLAGEERERTGHGQGAPMPAG